MGFVILFVSCAKIKAVKMKNFIISLFLIISTNLIYSQTEISPNFKIENDEIIWQKVIDVNENKKEFFIRLKSKEFFNKLNFNQIPIAGKTNNKDLNIKSPYWASFSFDSFVKIEFKEKRCRITFSNITFDGPELQVSGVKNKFDYKLSKESLKKGKIKDSKKVRRVMNSLNDFFESIVINKDDEKSDW